MCDFIRSARLDRCRRDLLDPAFADQPISAIASRWGLPSAPHFSRLFRQAYGCSPREFRRTSAAAPGAGASDGGSEDVSPVPPARWPLDLGDPWPPAGRKPAARPGAFRRMTGATLELEGLSAGYDRAAVVRELTMSVAPGEVVALIGANGAGKTTTLRAISGLVKPMGGCVRLDGADLAGVSPTARVRRGIVHVPQGRGIFYGLTVSEHFRLDGLRDRDEIEAAFAHFPALRELGGRRAGLLSGGEQQMLAIARALSRRPRVLLLDELSLGLAPVIVERLLPVVREFASTHGTAVLLVEQHVHLALEIADRGYVLSHGELVATDSAERLRGDNALLTASYLGEQRAGLPERLAAGRERPCHARARRLGRWGLTAATARARASLADSETIVVHDSAEPRAFASIVVSYR